MVEEILEFLILGLVLAASMPCSPSA